MGIKKNKINFKVMEIKNKKKMKICQQAMFRMKIKKVNQFRFKMRKCFEFIKIYWEKKV